MYEVDGVWMVIGITGNVQCHFTIGIEHEWAQKEKVTLTTLLLEEGLGWGCNAYEVMFGARNIVKHMIEKLMVDDAIIHSPYHIAHDFHVLDWPVPSEEVS
jgi:hypothetical protein